MWTLINTKQLLGLSLLVTLVLVASAFANPARAQTESSIDSCMMCHSNEDMTFTFASGEEISLYVDREVYESSVHGLAGHACTTCHTNIDGYPHSEVKAFSYRDFSLELYPLCAQCHEEQINAVQGNVHMVAFEGGNHEAAVCTDCHGNHNVRPPDEPRSAIPQTCRKCHSEIYDLYHNSIHGTALVDNGNPDVPSCTDCHGGHELIGPNNYPFHLFSPDLCAKCHTDPELMGRYGLQAGVYDTYVADFHGTTTTLFQSLAPEQETNKPVCIDCHGVHNILAVSDPTSSVIKENLLTTCRRCHPGATSNFPDSWLSHYKPSFEQFPIVFIVSWFYWLLIPMVIGGMLVFVFFDLIRKFINSRGIKHETNGIYSKENLHLRFPLIYRIEHWVLAINFTILSVTGLVQMFSSSPVSQWLIPLLGGVENVRVIHHICAVVIVGEMLFHIGINLYRGYIYLARSSIIPGLDDIKAAFQAFKYNIGLTTKRPLESRYTFAEKAEYWAVVWGTLIMVITGYMMWNPITTADFLPGEIIPAARAAHGLEAVLAVLAIIVWHFYFVLIKHFNVSMFTGYISKEIMDDEHPLELEEARPNGGLSSLNLSTRKRLWAFVLPQFLIICLFVSVMTYYSLTSEVTALSSIEPIEDVHVYSRYTEETPGAKITWVSAVEPIFRNRCGQCHGEVAVAGFNLIDFDSAIRSGAIVPGDPFSSKAVSQMESGEHPPDVTIEDLAIVFSWIANGAPYDDSEWQRVEIEGSIFDDNIPVDEDAVREPDGITWSSGVSDILQSTCGGCHGTNAMGGLNLTDYQAAVDFGAVVPGDPGSSSLINKMETGGHARELSEEDLEIIRKWIEAGAPFGDEVDGQDETEEDESVDESEGAGEEPDTPVEADEEVDASETREPGQTETSDEVVDLVEPDEPVEEDEPESQDTSAGYTWSADIKPILDAGCLSCHGSNAMGELDLTSYQSMMGAGVVVAGNAGSSRLVNKIAGGNHPAQLTEGELQIIRDWIGSGALE